MYESLDDSSEAPLPEDALRALGGDAMAAAAIDVTPEDVQGEGPRNPIIDHWDPNNPPETLHD